MGYPNTFVENLLRLSQDIMFERELRKSIPLWAWFFISNLPNSRITRRIIDYLDIGYTIDRDILKGDTYKIYRHGKIISEINY